MTLEAIQAALAAATPGEWWVNADGEIWAAQDPHRDSSIGVITIYGGPWEADAHLIAHAPEWLQALVDVAVAAQALREVAAENPFDAPWLLPWIETRLGAALAALEQRSAP